MSVAGQAPWWLTTSEWGTRCGGCREPIGKDVVFAIAYARGLPEVRCQVCMDNECLEVLPSKRVSRAKAAKLRREQRAADEKARRRHAAAVARVMGEA